MTRPFRIIPAPNFCFDASYFYQDKDRFAVRVLNEYTEAPLGQKIYSESTLKTAKPLADRSMDTCLSIARERLYKINGKLYYIAAENVFNRKGYPWRKYWKPSANIFFYIAMRGDRTMHIAETSMLTSVNKLHTNIHAQQEGFVVVAQIFCRSPEDTIPEVCKSLTGKPDHIFGNIDISKAIVQPPEKVNVIGASRYLNLSYVMTAPKTVKPNETFVVKVQAMSGDGKEKAIVNFDNFNIDAVDGYVPHTRVALKNGYGEFRAMALGLQDGETMRLKFNRNHLTGMGECTVLIKS